MKDVMFGIAQFIALSVVQGTPLLFGSTGEILTEKSGNLNLGIPGIMYIGAISGIVGGFFYQRTGYVIPLLAILIPLLCSLLGSLFAKLTNSETPNLTLPYIARPYKAHIPLFEGTWFGEMFFSYGFLVYVSIAIAIVATVILKRTRVGLQLRAVGESPATADAAGINVTKYKYFATCIGGMIAGLGGLYYVMDYSNGIWSNNAFGDRGWLAIALVIFAVWRPSIGIAGSYLFGGLYILYNYIRVSMKLQPIIQMLPYVVTILVLITVSLRKKRENLPPASLGMSYFREER